MTKSIFKEVSKATFFVCLRYKFYFCTWLEMVKLKAAYYVQISHEQMARSRLIFL